MLSFALYNKYIIHIHLVEKLISYYILNEIICIYSIDFKQLTINYTSESIQNKKKNFILYFLHAFCIEKLSYSRVIATYAKHSISDFGIDIGQLLGFSVVIRRNRMYSFLCQYIYNSICNEKGFDGLILKDIIFNQFGAINCVIKNIYIFNEIDSFFEQINEFFPNYQINININICMSTTSIVGMLLYFSHLQVPLNRHLYYNLIYC